MAIPVPAIRFLRNVYLRLPQKFSGVLMGTVMKEETPASPLQQLFPHDRP